MTTPDTGNRLTALRRSLGRSGIWAPPPERFGMAPVELAAAVDKLGFGSLWIGGSHLAPPWPRPWPASDRVRVTGYDGAGLAGSCRDVAAGRLRT